MDIGGSSFSIVDPVVFRALHIPVGTINHVSRNITQFLFFREDTLAMGGAAVLLSPENISVRSVIPEGALLIHHPTKFS